MRAFPPGRRGVLLPLTNRRTAARGIAMYTATKRWVVIAQLLAFWFVRVFGARFLPGRTVVWCPPCTEAVWADLVDQWQSELGPLTHFAAYQRRQSDRSGLTLIATNDGAAVAVIKLRDEQGPLAAEHRALAAVAGAGLKHFRSPKPLASGQCGELYWTAQECVFDRPHRPVLEVTDALFDEVAAGLEPALPEAEHDHEQSDSMDAAAHGDLTPWNLRKDAVGVIWLFDWEDAGRAPAGSDRTYYRLTTAAMKGGPAPIGMPPLAVSHWRRAIRSRESGGVEDARLTRTLLAMLETADVVTTEPVTEEAW